jgi:alpha-D-ribose 1-methylphosphonate 5-triphosphate synthase subunit PhnH
MVTAGFATPVLSAQLAFRALLNATARPGRVLAIGTTVSAPPPLSAGAAVVALTLCDQDTPIWLDPGLRSASAVVTWLQFHCGSAIVDDPRRAAFAIVGRPMELPDFEHFNVGVPDYPDRSTTIVLQVETFQAGPVLNLAGPGIRSRQPLRVSPFPDDMASRLTANRGRFPCGVDLLLVTMNEVAALPRSVRIVNEDS